MKLNLKDRRILYELDKYSRIPYSKIAKIVGLSQETVRYRVKNLLILGVIKKFLTMVDTARLGFAYHKVLLRLHNVDESKINEIIGYLKENKLIVWVVTTDGDYDIGFVAKVTNILELNNILEDLKRRYNEFLNKKTISVNVTGEYLTRDYLIDKSRKAKTEVSYTVDYKPYDLDKIDIGIMQFLAENSRVSAIEIGKNLNISPDSVLKRLKRLEKDRIITRNTIVLDHELLNQIHYKVLVQLNNVPVDKIASFIDYCRTITRVVYIIKSLGEWDYELDLEVESVQQFRELMRDLTKKYSDIIEDYNALIINKIHKYNVFP